VEHPDLVRALVRVDPAYSFGEAEVQHFIPIFAVETPEQQVAAAVAAVGALEAEATPAGLCDRTRRDFPQGDDVKQMTDVNQGLASLFGLTDRVAVVTGATKGLGRAIAEGLAQAGASVVVSSRKQDLCEEAAAEIKDSTGRETFAAACHMGDWDAIRVFVERVYERFGRVDVLVNNAGINPAFLSVVDLTSEYLDKLFAVNLKGPVRLAGLVAPRMREHGGGSIVNVATVGAYTGGPGVGAYTSVKAGLINFTKVMAQEWAGWGVRVNAICPGPFDSAMMRGGAKIDASFPERAAGGTLQRRVADVREIVGAAVYFASDASSFVTGEDHIVAGGILR
jgi:NAD(P)-dependent dehydrogenase (short-subunit alcohol dehydrogenase family)